MLLAVMLQIQPPNDPGAALHAWEQEAERQREQAIHSKATERGAKAQKAIDCYQAARRVRSAFDAIVGEGAAVSNIERKADAISAVKEWKRCEGVK